MGERWSRGASLEALQMIAKFIRVKLCGADGKPAFAGSATRDRYTTCAYYWKEAGFRWKSGRRSFESFRTAMPVWSKTLCTPSENARTFWSFVDDSLV
jgi:hypothetical protein